MRQFPRLLGLAATLGVAACAAVPPAGPTVLALPPQGKDFASFQREDAFCQQTAGQQSGLGNASQVAGNSTVGGAGLGALGGAAVGALIGSVTGSAGAGAAIGAGTGLVGGGLLGSSRGQEGSFELQRRFDAVYAQCMTAYGNQLGGRPRPFAQAPIPVFPVPAYGFPAFGYPAFAAPVYGRSFYGPSFYGPSFYGSSFYGPPPVSLSLGFSSGPRYGYGHRRGYW